MRKASLFLSISSFAVTLLLMNTSLRLFFGDPGTREGLIGVLLVSAFFCVPAAIIALALALLEKGRSDSDAVLVAAATLGLAAANLLFAGFA